MWRDLGLTEQDWEQTPPEVRALLISLQHQLRLLEIRHTGYELQIAALREQVAQIDLLKAEIADLRERLGQNSGNSSLPPSSDRPDQRKKKKKERTGRRRGGQPGHQGYGRRLKPLNEVDQVVELRPASCAGCGGLLLGDDPEPERHQVSEVPPIKAIITEYRRHTLSCPGCGQQTRADWPVEMPEGSFGPRAEAIIGYLSGRLNVSHRDLSEAMEVLHGIEMSAGSIAPIQRRISEALEQPVEAVRRFIIHQRVRYVDETRWYEEERMKWMWVDVACEVTSFQILGGRGAGEAKAVIGEQSLGVIVTDRLGSYGWMERSRRQVCWAHLKRDFQAISEREGKAGEVGSGLLEQTGEVFRLWHGFRQGEVDRERLRTEMAEVESQVKALLEAGSASGHQKTRGTCQKILEVWPALWTFVRVEGVEPTNNGAERALRRGVLWRRKSFGTQSAAGSEFVARILTVVTSLRQQGRDVMDYLRRVCQAAISEAVPESLIPNSS
jgi:transposase